MDLGYFGRDITQTKDPSKAYYKIAVNYWHPTEYFQNVRHKSDRFGIFKYVIKPMRTGGDHILMAGIGPKSSVLYDIKHQSWDTWAIEELNKYTTMPIWYRAKPNHADKFHSIPGSKWSDPRLPLLKVLNKAWAVITRHSNVAVDGLINGIPCFVADGVCLKLGLIDLSKITKPHLPSIDERLQFCCDLAYTQWNIKEITRGETWRHLKNEGLI
jgi:hypothetical protein